MQTHRTILWFLCLLISQQIFAMEICDNGLDDDGNGLIDFNDPACDCLAYVSSSLIPNPSFEAQSCCPEANDMMQCVDNWVQASAPTTDYVHTCEGFLGNSEIQAQAPLPFPDGEGGIGIRDGVILPVVNAAGYKEYLGTCLPQPMESGKSYKLDFFVGFQEDVPGSQEFDIAIFGSSDCINLPFGNQQDLAGCPEATDNYSLLGMQTASGSNEWVNVSFEFEPSENLSVLVLGPGCAYNPNAYLQPYFFIDHLRLEEKQVVSPILVDVSGSICTEDLLLLAPLDSDLSYQWYHDGIALTGETSSALAIPNNALSTGTYLVVMDDGEQCFPSEEYFVTLPPYYSLLDISICEGDVFNVGEQDFQTGGYYEQSIPASDGCDSIIQLNLSVLPNTSSNETRYLCEGEPIEFFDQSIEEAGSYNYSIPNTAGCDSLITLEVLASQSSEGFELMDQVELALGQAIDLSPSSSSEGLSDYLWYEQDFSLLGEGPELLDYRPLESSTIYLQALDEYGCSLLDSIQLLVDKSQSALMVPNAFSPNGDAINDHFRLLLDQGIENLDHFQVFDRWGKLLYEETSIAASKHHGWDGSYRGAIMPMGVYVYYVQARFIDGRVDVLHGNFTLVR